MPSDSAPGVSRTKRSTASSCGASPSLAGQHAHLARPHIAGALAAVVVDLQMVQAAAAHFEQVTLPELGMGGGVRARRSAQRGGVLRDDGQGRQRDGGAGSHH
jgi:hypothetical protein